MMVGNKQKESIQKKINNAPNLPGVYTFIDKKGAIIYVGKAVSLVKRLKSYFDSSLKHPKTLKMVELANDLKYYVTNTEIEALLLEASLIKTEKPRFNVKLKDAKGYPYIKLTKEDYPRLIVTRNTDDEDAIYYGPYVNVKDLRFIVKDLHYIFPLRRCKKSKFNEGKVCLYYQMKQCEGPCEKIISKDEYRQIVENVKLFFDGKIDELENNYKTLMTNYASKLEFEKAAKYRDRLKSLENIFTRQSAVVNFSKNTDLFYFSDKNMMCVTHMFIRNCNITGIDSKCYDDGELISHSEFVLNFYKNTAQIPESVCLVNYNDEFSGDKLIEAISNLKGGKVEYRKKVPSGLLEILRKNNELAEKQFMESLAGVEKVKSGFARVIKEKSVRLVECIDISHIFGSFTVGASVCFDIDEQVFVKEKYRRYKIRNIDNNDFESIYQVISRKADKIIDGKEEKSDVYVIDGGLGQLNAAKKAFEEKGIDAEVISIAKGRSKDINEKLENEISPEYIFVKNRKNPLNFKKSDFFLLFIQKIRDEAHRFVVEYARSIALAHFKNSSLKDIKGIGEKRAKKLLMEYPDLREILNEDIVVVSNKTGIPVNILKQLIDKLHKQC
ncbi:MAG: excinuclease subunit [Deferribacteraceae bacterium]|nr:excinuclease subunit [Deferribacteraceae bacterium]